MFEEMKHNLLSHLSQFDDFDRLVYLDADMVVLENIDHLLTDPDPSFKAVMDCFCEPTWSHRCIQVLIFNDFCGSQSDHTVISFIFL